MITTKADLMQNSEGTWLSFLLKDSKPQASRLVAKINASGKDWAVEVERHSPKRSLDSNRYAWKLIGLMADKLTSSEHPISKDDVYLQMLKSYGQGAVLKVQNRNKDMFERSQKYWEIHETLTDSDCTFYRFWVGSSEYSTVEMSIFIKGIVHECQQLEIEIMTPQELEQMMAMMAEQERKAYEKANKSQIDKQGS